MLINDITLGADDLAITKAVIAMGHSLGLKVVAEGVESNPQADILQDLQCDTLQGFCFSKPMPVKDILAQ